MKTGVRFKKHLYLADVLELVSRPLGRRTKPLTGHMWPAGAHLESLFYVLVHIVASRRDGSSATEVEVRRPRKQTEHVEMGVCDNHVGSKNGEEDSGKAECPMERLLQEGGW
ncbi:hypothetical protein ANN_01423 [Periplaneta americana]|uniref:Uncharacterized protein n=1 Tax=Periplaneta americana TaxID=6978 RepID=A0ABQ8TVY7_PERAM|nr:hypothetical protein ANN_01423 [Periplaneta americana]